MAKLDIETFKDGDKIFNEGDESTHMYFVKSGKLRVTKKGHDDKEIELGHISPGELVGEISYFDKSPRSANVYSVGQSELAFIPADKFEKIFSDLPSWFQALTHSLVKRIRRSDEDLCT